MDEYAAKVDELTDEMNTLVEHSKEKYFVLTHSNYEWCGVAIKRLQAYVQRLQNSTKDEAMKQHRIEIQALKDGLNKITAAKDGLNETYTDFLKGAFKNVALTTILNTKFNEYNDQHVHKLLVQLIWKAEKSKRCVLKICWDTDLTRQIKSLMETIDKKRVKIHTDLVQALENIDIHMEKMKSTFWADILAIRDVIPQVKAALETIKNAIEKDSHDSTTINEIKIAVEKMIEECKNYRARHEP